MSLDSYIKQEQDYLNQESQKFVAEFPQVSQFLSEPSYDPDVHRMLDGFAYLSSLLHAKADQEYPQLSENLMDMLWPNYLQSTPSMTIIEFHSQDSKCLEIATQSTVLSTPTAENPIPCKFKTTRSTWVTPFKLNNIAKVSSHTLDLNFCCDPLCTDSSNDSIGQNLSQAGIDKLRLFLGADMMSGFQLYLYFAHYLSSATLLINDQTLPLPDLELVPVSFDAQDAILKYPNNTYAGYRLLHEYFCFIEGFLFFDIKGFPDYLDKLNANTFKLQFTFTQPLPAEVKLTIDSIKINCTPVINLFDHDSEPINLSGEKTEYPLYLSHQQPDHYELFSIENIKGWVNNQSRHYTEFSHFLHQTNGKNNNHSHYYHVNRKVQANTEHIDYYLSFVRNDETELQNKNEVISIHTLCSNRDAAQKLRIGDICVPGEGIPPLVSLTNVIYPSRVIRPNLDLSQQWTTISSLSLNYLSLLNKNSLCQILQNYNFAARYQQRSAKSLEKLLSSIEHFDSAPYQQYYHDLIIEGHESTLQISPDAFNNIGEMYLFGTVLAHFYANYATVNSFHFLKLINSSTHEVYQWSLMNV